MYIKSFFFFKLIKPGDGEEKHITPSNLSL